MRLLHTTPPHTTLPARLPTQNLLIDKEVINIEEILESQRHGINLSLFLSLCVYMYGLSSFFLCLLSSWLDVTVTLWWADVTEGWARVKSRARPRRCLC